MERSQYQYQPVTGPVWREPIAEKLAWQPSARQPARGLPPNRLGDFAQPPFQALYKPEGLQWIASDRYAGRPLAYSLVRHGVLDPIPPVDPRQLSWQAQDRYSGRALPRALLDWSVYPQQITAPAYDPQRLEWTPQGRAPQVPVERRILGDFVQPAFVALYDPRRLEWQAQDRYYGRAPQRSPFDWTVFQQPIIVQAFDPKTLDWLPRGIAPQIPVELRKIGDFAQPAFDALYKPAGLQWWSQERHAGGQFPRGATEIRRIGTFVQPAFSALYKPEQLQWLLTGQQPARGIRFVYTGSWVVDPALLASGTVPPIYGFGARSAIGTRSAVDPAKQIGTGTAAKADSGIGTGSAADPNKGIGSSKA